MSNWMVSRAGMKSAATTTSRVGKTVAGSSWPWLLSMNAAAPAPRASNTPMTSTNVRRRLLSLNSISMVAGSCAQVAGLGAVGGRAAPYPCSRQHPCRRSCLPWTHRVAAHRTLFCPIPPRTTMDHTRVGPWEVAAVRQGRSNDCSVSRPIRVSSAPCLTSSSSRPSSPPAISPRPSSDWSTGSRPEPSTRSCWAPRARARRTPSARSSPGPASPRWCWRTTRRSRRSSTASSATSSRTTRSSTSSATSTTTSRRPTFRAAIPTSRRTPAATTRSTSCDTRPPARCSSAAT